MVSSSAQHTENVQKTVEDLTTFTEAPNVAIDVERIEFKSNNYLGTFQLPADREYLTEAKEWLLNCPLSHAFQINPLPYNKELLASVWSTAEVIGVRNSKGQLVQKIRLTYTTKNEQGDEIYESIDFNAGSLRNTLQIPVYKPYTPEVTKEEIIQFLDEIHIKWDKKKKSDEPNKSLTTIKRHQLNTEFNYIFAHFI